MIDSDCVNNIIEINRGRLMRNEDCAYLNDIKGCDVVAVYECGDIIEIEYLKNGMHKSLTIEYCRFGSSMEYGSFFCYGGVELAQWVIHNQRMWTKELSEILIGIKTILEINVYFENCYGDSYNEQLEIVYTTEDGQTNTYLLDVIDYDKNDVMESRCIANKKPTFKKRECEDEKMPTELFSVEVCKNVLAFALKAHGNQKTPEGLPYSFHIVSVATEIINSLSQHRISYDEANVAVACALLHDVLEDTETTMGTESLDIPNIEAVLTGVWALTKNEKLPTKQEQMQDSITRLGQQPKCVQMVKLADRITNLAPAPDFWNRAKRQAYVDEARIILEALKDSNSYLANKLQSKIDNYEVEKDDNFLAFYSKDKQLVLDKNHPKYLKTFKAINRLNEYALKKYELDMFDTHTHTPTKDGLEKHKKVGVSYIMQVLNSKNLLDLNTQIDSKIDRFISTILDGEDCIS